MTQSQIDAGCFKPRQFLYEGKWRDLEITAADAERGELVVSSNAAPPGELATYKREVLLDGSTAWRFVDIGGMNQGASAWASPGVMGWLEDAWREFLDSAASKPEVAR